MSSRRSVRLSARTTNGSRYLLSRGRAGGLPPRNIVTMPEPVLTPDLLNGYADRISDFEVELVENVGHWIVEQPPELVLDRLRAFLNAEK